MPQKILKTVTVLIFGLIVASCQNTEKKAAQVKDENNFEEASSTAISSSSKIRTEKDVRSYLEKAEFRIEVKGQVIFREDQLGDANPADLKSSINVLRENEEQNKLAIYYLRVAGSSLDDLENSVSFINDVILIDSDYLEHVDRMVKSIQRQDRPTIKKALLNTIKEMSDAQCVDYLQKCGYVIDQKSSPIKYNPRALKGLPMDLRLAFLNNLKSEEDEIASSVFSQMKTDLGLTS
ncbi:MAG: hypothetical protein JXR07_15880 [Reichenbachiella sp.]